MNTFQKQPAEAYTIAIEFLNKLPTGTTVASGTVAGFDIQAGATDNTILASTTATCTTTQARVKVQAGANNKDYKITFTCTLNDSSILEEDILMQVRAL